MLLEGLTDEEVDEFNKFYKKKVPKYFGSCIPDDGQFNIKAAIGNDLGKLVVASRIMPIMFQGQSLNLFCKQKYLFT